MVWGYSTFNSAWGDLETFYEAAEGYWPWVNTYVLLANTEATGEAWEQAIRLTTTAITWLDTYCRCIFDFWAGEDGRSHFMASMYYASKEPTGAAVTMSAIITAMLTATPEQIKYFIGIADGYRQSIWNKEFNQEFYAALAKGFEQWV